MKSAALKKANICDPVHLHTSDLQAGQVHGAQFRETKTEQTFLTAARLQETTRIRNVTVHKEFISFVATFAIILAGCAIKMNHPITDVAGNESDSVQIGDTSGLQQY
ncbi:MAG: hypothetical protein R8G34_17320 [Paracoccaceae bacterium]|nr:hypothetical protein [Paracoccaceae bacterium]